LRLWSIDGHLILSLKGKKVFVILDKLTMDLATFKQSIEDATPPPATSPYLLAMWLDGQGNWDKAHSMVDNLEDATACWVHAYLHHKEGDLWNADYWYRKAGKKRPDVSLQQEWETIVKSLL